MSPALPWPLRRSAGLEMLHYGRPLQKRPELRAPFAEGGGAAKTNRVILERAPADHERVTVGSLDGAAQLVRYVARACGDRADGARENALEVRFRGWTDRDHRKLENHFAAGCDDRQLF